MYLILLFMSLTSLVFSAPSQDLLRFYPTEVLPNEIVEFKPIAGHHFSTEAPQNCGAGQLVDHGPMSVKCQFSVKGQTQLSLNVCDDALTFCRPLNFKIAVLDKPGVAAELLTKNQKLNSELHKKLIPGFTKGSVDEITKEALARGQPVFAMVSTDWCPPCNEAKEFLLSTPGFQKASENWFKVYIDGDSLEATQWSGVVPFTYFPSFVLLTPSLQEVDRYTGEYRQADFEKWADETRSYSTDPVVALKARVLARQSGSLKQKFVDLYQGVGSGRRHQQEVRLLRWALDQDEREVIFSLLKGAEFPELNKEVLHFQIQELVRADEAAGLGEQKATKISLHHLLLDESLRGDHFGVELAKLCELDAGNCRPFLALIDSRLAFLNSRKDLTEAEKSSQMAEDFLYFSEALQLAGDKAEAKAFARKCAGYFDVLGQKSVLKISRAGQQGMVACLEMAGDFAREEQVLKQLVSAYPTEPTFMSRMARMFRKQKKYDQALTWLEKAERQSYGYNWFSLQALKVDVLLDLRRAKEARKVIAGALAQVSLGGGRDSRNQGLLAKLRGLQAKVEKAK